MDNLAEQRREMAERVLTAAVRVNPEGRIDYPDAIRAGVIGALAEANWGPMAEGDVSLQAKKHAQVHIDWDAPGENMFWDEVVEQHEAIIASHAPTRVELTEGARDAIEGAMLILRHQKVDLGHSSYPSDVPLVAETTASIACLQAILGEGGQG